MYYLMLTLLPVDVEHYLRRNELVSLQSEVALLKVLQPLSHQKLNCEVTAQDTHGDR